MTYNSQDSPTGADLPQNWQKRRKKNKKNVSLHKNKLGGVLQPGVPNLPEPRQTNFILAMTAVGVLCAAVSDMEFWCDIFIIILIYCVLLASCARKTPILLCPWFWLSLNCCAVLSNPRLVNPDRDPILTRGLTKSDLAMALLNFSVFVVISIKILTTVRVNYVLMFVYILLPGVIIGTWLNLLLIQYSLIEYFQLMTMLHGQKTRPY